MDSSPGGGCSGFDCCLPLCVACQPVIPSLCVGELSRKRFRGTGTHRAFIQAIHSSHSVQPVTAVTARAAVGSPSGRCPGSCLAPPLRHPPLSRRWQKRGQKQAAAHDWCWCWAGMLWVAATCWCCCLGRWSRHPECPAQCRCQANPRKQAGFCECKYGVFMCRRQQDRARTSTGHQSLCSVGHPC